MPLRLDLPQLARSNLVQRIFARALCSACQGRRAILDGRGDLLMFHVTESMHVRAPIERCFLLSTSVPLVEKILGMRPVEGQTTGLVGMGDRVLWRGWKFGLPVKHETLITGFEPPYFFQDTMARGQFRHFHHDHTLEEVGGQTLFVDVVEFSLPFGAAGRLVGRTVVAPHVLHLLRHRFSMLKQIAESEEWRRYVPETAAEREKGPAAGESARV